MKRLTALLMVPLALAACQPKADAKPAAAAAAAPAEPPKPDPNSPEGKIANATSAAPSSIAANATVMDWPSTPDGQMTQLRAGTNGWTCMPDDKSSPANDPMCLDSHWMEWAAGYMTKKPPKVTGTGIAYMLQGASDASNTDPYATEPAAGQERVISGPHIMVVVPDPKSLDKMSDDYKSGQPYVMWKGTPYAHMMVPVK